jgi:type VI secretion system protein ImpK
MPDDPFSGLGFDRTVIMPTPGGRAAPVRPTPAAPGGPAEVFDTPAVVSGLNPLVAAANSLLNVVPQLRASLEHPNPTGLRDSLARGIQQFEARARAAGARTEQIVAARYALCTLIDETAASTPWGASGAWAQHGLLVLFHNETGGGEKVFQLLARLAENPQANLDVLELMYVCLQFGLEGRYRVMDGGQRQLEAIQQRLVMIIRKQRGDYERDLSPNWRGGPAVAQAKLGWVSLGAVAAVTALLLVVIFLGFKLSLSRASDTLAPDIAALRVAAHIVPPRVAAEPRVAPLLAEEVRRGLVAVDDRPDRSIVTVPTEGLFRPGEATISGEDHFSLLRVAEALATLPGQVDVIGHTDNVPIRTLRFPSNWELSVARAEAVGRVLATRVAVERIRVDGRGGADPLTSNDTAEGRARNSRVEIMLYVPAGVAPAAGGPRPAAPR